MITVLFPQPSAISKNFCGSTLRVSFKGAFPGYVNKNFYLCTSYGSFPFPDRNRHNNCIKEFEVKYFMHILCVLTPSVSRDSRVVGSSCRALYGSPPSPQQKSRCQNQQCSQCCKEPCSRTAGGRQFIADPVGDPDGPDAGFGIKFYL